MEDRRTFKAESHQKRRAPDAPREQFLPMRQLVGARIKRGMHGKAGRVTGRYAQSDDHEGMHKATIMNEMDHFRHHTTNTAGYGYEKLITRVNGISMTMGT
jgi:hypothetical protein